MLQDKMSDGDNTGEYLFVRASNQLEDKLRRRNKTER